MKIEVRGSHLLSISPQNTQITLKGLKKYVNSSVDIKLS